MKGHSTFPEAQDVLLYHLMVRYYTKDTLAQTTGAVEYTDYISVERYKPRPTSVLDVTLNNLMARL